jgi:hypothetical protein
MRFGNRFIPSAKFGNFAQHIMLFEVSKLQINILRFPNRKDKDLPLSNIHETG